MVESSTRATFAVNLEEFERRLRGPAGASVDPAVDPLAALAQLVGDEGKSQASRHGVFSAGARAPEPVRPTVKPAVSTPPKVPNLQQNFAEQLRALHAHHDAMRQALAEGRTLESPEVEHAQPDNAQAHVPDTDFHLRGFEDAFAAAGIGAQPAQADDGTWDERPDAAADHFQGGRPSVYDTAQPPVQGTQRPKGMVAMGVIFAVGLVMLGASFAIRHSGANAQSGEAPLIKADTTPVRVVPAKPEGVVIANQNTDILDTGKQKVADAANLAKDQVVANQEQPDDLNALPKSTATAPAPVGQPVTSAVAPPPSPDAGSAPNPQGAVTPGAQTAPSQASQAGSNSPAPTNADVHKVHTVVVNPNFSLGAQGAGAAAAATTPNAAAHHVAAKLPEHRVVKPKIVQAIKPVMKPKPPLRRVAVAQQPNAPLQLVPTRGRVSDNAKAKPQRVASLASTKGAGKGFFAIQLAAPGTEAGAKSMMNRLSARYGSVLQGHHLGYHRVSLNGHDVFRVRVDHVSSAAALSICKAIRGKGGSCWISGE